MQALSLTGELGPCYFTYKLVTLRHTSTLAIYTVSYVNSQRAEQLCLVTESNYTPKYVWRCIAISARAAEAKGGGQACAC